MKPIRFQQWGPALLAPGIRRPGQCQCPALRASRYSIITNPTTRLQSTTQLLTPPSTKSDNAPVTRTRGRGRKKLPEVPPSSPSSLITSPSDRPDEPIIWESGTAREPPRRADVTESTFRKEKLPSPPINTLSPKLAALHARLSLSSRIPIQTLARCLVDETADPDYRFNNSLLGRLGRQLLAYHLLEHLMCQYPRLPMPVLVAAMEAYIGPSSLQALTHDWGVEVAAEPGGEVDPGLLQFRRELPTKRVKDEITNALRNFTNSRAAEAMNQGRRVTDMRKIGLMSEGLTATLEQASRNFVRAVFAAIYLHCGAKATQDFVRAHILSRHLDLGSLFSFKQPTRDLSRLCAREGFDPPVARLISETGRLSRHPVFVVGIFSGVDKIGEDAGASLDEARFRAATNALRGWYLYSPRTEAGELLVPSMMIGDLGSGKKWQPVHVDDGEVIV